MEKSPITLTVCVVTYNQENYVEECLQSILDQQTSFDFEVLVADDCSTDATRDILLRFQQQYPAVIKLLFHEKNLGAFENYKAVHRAARGEYVAHVDGDDCIYSGKLEAQVQFLAQQRDCALVAHRMDLWDGHKVINQTAANPQSISLETLLLAHPMFLNSATMYRRSMLDGFADSGDEIIDFYTYVYAALRGTIGFLAPAYGRYTVNVGISSKRTLMPHIQRAIDLAEGRVDRHILQRARARQYVSYAIAALMAGSYPEFSELISKARATGGLSGVARLIYLLRRHAAPIRSAVRWYKEMRLSLYRART